MGRKQTINKAWLVLLGVILIRGFAGGGINMTSGLFLSPVSKTLGVGIGSLSIYLSITSIVMVLWLPAAGRLINRYDIRWIAFLGAALQIVPFMAFAWMNHVSAWYVLAVPHAMGAALLVNLMGPVLINRWFAKNTGLMLGIQMAFVGLFGAVLQPVTSGIIAASGWRSAYFIIGAAALAAVVLSTLFLIKDRPEKYGIAPYGAKALNGGEKISKEKDGNEVEISEKTALHSAAFYLLLFFMIAITGIGVFTQHIPTYGHILGYSVRATGTALSFASIGSAVGSVAIGLVSDRIGSLKTCYILIGIGFAAVAGFFFSGMSYGIFSVSTFMHGLVSSGIMVLAPILTLKFFGRKDYEKIFAKVSMGAPIASIVLIPAYGFIYDKMHSYRAVLLGMGVLLAAAAFCIAFGWRRRCTENGCPGFKIR